ncbi:MAG: Rpn family recombination-promoting nuclease/putative transposase [Candidatus Sericytochromatia bacterium]
MIEERYINPFTDFGFKKLFGEEDNKDLLIDFLNSLLYKEHKHKIKDLTFKKTEHLGSTEMNRKAIFDLYCEDEIGQKFIVELQKAEQKFFKDRTVYYSTFPIQEQAKRGDWDYQLNHVYCIGILDFTFDEDKDFPDKYLYEVELTERLTKKLFYDKLLYVYIEIPKFKKREDELESNVDKWLYFLKYLSNFEEIPKPLQTEMFIKAFEIAEIANFNEEQKFDYEKSMKYYRDLKNVIDTSEELGFEKGYVKGEFIGIQKGKIEGKIEGKEERNFEIITNMYSKGFSFDTISDISNLSVEKIKNILKIID